MFVAVKKCMSLLLSRTHTSGIWLDRRIHIDADSIDAIMRLPMDGEDVGDAFSKRIVVQAEAAVTEEHMDPWLKNGTNKAKQG